jgi:hypothetical protein
MSGVAADRACVHGARAIDVPPGSARREKRDSREGSGKRRQTQPPNCAGPYHFSAVLYLQNVAFACHHFVKYRIYKESDHQARKQSGLDAIAHLERMRGDARHSLGFMPAPEGKVQQEHHNQNSAESADDCRTCREIERHR